MRALRGHNASAVLATINPITRGWASYYRSVASSETFTTAGRLPVAAHLQVGLPQPPEQAEALGHQTVLRPVQPVQAQPVGVRRPRPAAPTSPGSPGPRIVRHRKVIGGASPDDPALTDYWDQRRGRNQPPLDRSTLRLLKRQHGRCAICADLLLHADREPHTPDEWQQWHRTTRKAITRQPHRTRTAHGTPDDTRLIHTYCQRRATGAAARNRHLHSPEPPSGACLSRMRLTSRTSGSEGAGAQQCVPATRLNGQFPTWSTWTFGNCRIWTGDQASPQLYAIGDTTVKCSSYHNIAVYTELLRNGALVATSANPYSYFPNTS